MHGTVCGQACTRQGGANSGTRSARRGSHLGDSRFVGGGDGTVSLAQVRDLLVKVGESGFEGFAVLRVGRGFEVVNDSDSREL
jgi:hypothetical protein